MTQKPPTHWTLRYLDGNFTIAQSPSVLNANLQLHSRLVRLYNFELHQAIAGHTIWPPDEAAQPLYQQFQIYFQKLGALLDPPIDTDLLEPVSRHLFFVCTEPFQEEDRLIPGLSGLSQLLGYFHSSESQLPPAEPKHTTGDAELDVLVSALLIYKDQAFQLAQLLSLNELTQVCIQGNDRMKTSEEEQIANTPPPEEPYVEDERFIEEREAIVENLEGLGIQIPRGF